MSSSSPSNRQIFPMCTLTDNSCFLSFYSSSSLNPRFTSIRRSVLVVLSFLSMGCICICSFSHSTGSFLRARTVPIISQPHHPAVVNLYCSPLCKSLSHTLISVHRLWNLLILIADAIRYQAHRPLPHLASTLLLPRDGTPECGFVASLPVVC